MHPEQRVAVRSRRTRAEGQQLVAEFVSSGGNAGNPKCCKIRNTIRYWTASEPQSNNRANNRAMVGASMPDDIRAAAEFLASDADALRVFDAIEAGHGKASGWAIAKNVEIAPEAAARLLKTLKQTGAVDSTDAGL